MDEELWYFELVENVKVKDSWSSWNVEKNVKVRDKWSSWSIEGAIVLHLLFFLFLYYFVLAGDELCFIFLMVVRALGVD